ncbi:MAG: TIGR04282 family arsenosugar biosynthesis glycosyltransferase [Deltaproteobacteria bacterium]|nr:TIGR04282 family arsenosugar biosynthesis glycosyltransferase [Deltaproteobacteria bacterium]MBI3390931.1 TIGR04282 family arsenosugar biosynthesis glycosyltransferase [Deltaproteobacteria bacterium]
MLPSCLAVMARYPEVGTVKTRLAGAIGAERACALYRAFLRDLDARFAPQPGRELVWLFHPPERDFAAIVSAGSRCVAQTGRDLGERMHAGFVRLLGEGFAKVLMIGADVPHIRDEWLDDAERALDHADVVLGPTADGGYYLIAMREPHDVFSGIAMSTSEVLAQTQAKAAAAGLRVHLLPPSFDIDEEADVVQLRELLAHSAWAARLRATAAELRNWL